MKGFLHIGTPKTATTTLQDFLGLNREKLLENGYVNTTSAGGDNDFNLAVAAFNPGSRNGLTNLNNITTDSELEAVQRKVVTNLTLEIEALQKVAGGKGQAVFSSEYFQLQLTTREEIQRLKDVLNTIGVSDVDVIVYLRDPVGLATSYFSTGVKAGGDSAEPPHPSNTRYSHLCDHQNTLENFASVFGKTHIIPRIFDKNEFKNQSIIDDFLQIIGIDDGDAYTIPENSNESLSSEGIAILCRLNRVFPRWIGTSLNPLYRYLITFMENNYSNGTYAMPQALHESYVSYFEPSNEWVRKNYFPERASLFKSKPYRQGVAYEGSGEELDVVSNDVANRLLAEIQNTDLSEFVKNKKHLSSEYSGLTEAEQKKKNREIVHLSIGISQYHLHQYKSSLNSIENVLTVNPGNTDARLFKAMCLRELLDYKTSEEIFSHILAKYPDHHQALTEFAVLAEKQGDVVLAESRWTKVLLKFPERTDVLTNTGVARYKAGNFIGALECFDRLLVEDDQSRNAIYRKAKCLVAMEKYQEADVVLRHGVETHPDYLPFQTLYAQVPHFQKDWQAAIDRWQSLSRHHTDLPQAELGLGTCHYESGNYERGLIHLGKCLETEPENQLAMLLSAKCDISLDNLDAAEIKLRECTKRHPDSLSAHSALANIAELRLDWSEALNRWSSVSTRFPDNDKALFQCGECHRQLADNDNAVASYKSALEINPAHKQSMLGLALCYKEMNQLDPAESILRTLQKEHNDFLPGFFEFANLPVINEDYAESARRWQNVSQKFPDDTRAFLQSAIFYTRTDQYEPALSQLEHLLELQPDHQQALLLKAQSLVALARFDEAELLLEKGQGLYPEIEAFFTENALIPVKQEHWVDAAERWSLVADRFPKNTLYVLRAGDYHKKSGNHNKAIAYLQQLIEKEPANKNAGYLLSQSYKEVAQYENAEQVLINAMRANGDFVQLSYEYAGLPALQDNYDEAARRWADVAAKFPSDTRAPLQSAIYFNKTRQYPQCQAQSRLLLNRDPDHQQGLLLQAQSLVALEQYSDAETILKGAQEKYPDVEAFQSEHAMIAVRQENWSEASLRWSALAARYDDKSHYLVRAGDACKRNGDFELAIEIYRKLIALDASLQAPWLIMAQCYKEIGQIESAEKTLLNAQTEHADYISAYYEYASLPVLQDNFDQAARRWADVAAKFPSDTRAPLQSAIYFNKTRQYPQCQAQSRLLLNRDPDHQQGLLLQIQSLVALEQYSDAETVLKGAVEKHPDVEAFQSEHAMNAVRQENWSEASLRWSALAARYDDKSQYLVRTGDAYKRNGDFEAAIETYKKLIVIDATLQAPWLALAQCYKELGQLVSAEETLLKAQVQHPDYIAVFYEYAHLATVAGNAKASAERWAMVATKFSDDVRALLQAAIFHYKVSEFRSSVVQSTKLLAIEPEHQQALLVQAQALLGLNRVTEAELSLKQGQQCYPEFAPFFIEYAQIAVKCDNKAEAAVRWGSVASQFPGNVSYESKAGDWFRKCQDYVSAAKHLEQARTIEPDNKNLYLSLALCYKELRRYTDADVLLEQAIEHNPDVLSFYYEHANIPVVTKDDKEAASRWLKVADRFATDKRAQLQAGILSYKDTRFEDAIVRLKRVLTMEPDNQQAHLLLTRSLIAVGRFSEADDSLVVARELFPEVNTFATEYAANALRQENWPEAATRWSNAAELFPGNVHYCLSAGTCYKKASQHQRALKCFNDVLAVDPEHQVALQHKAQSLVELDKLVLAERVLEQLQRCYPDLAAARTEYATLATKQKNWSDAEVRWQMALPYIQNTGLANFHTSFAQMKLGKYQAAIGSIDKLLQLEPSHQAGLKLKAQCQVLLESQPENQLAHLKAQTA